MKKFKVMLSVFMVITIIFVSVVPAFAEYVDNNRAEGALLDDMDAISDSNDEEFPCSTNNMLPSAVDLSTSNSFPPVGDQGYISSCASWATTYYQFGYQIAAMNNWNAKDDPSKRFSPKWSYNLVNGGNDSGSSFKNNYNLLTNHGAVRYTEFTPNGYSEDISEYREWCTDTDSMREALRYRVTDFKKYNFDDSDSSTPISSYNSITLTPMKSLLNSGYILTFSSKFDTLDYETLSVEDGSSHIGEKVCIKQLENINDKDSHALAIVGYDDSIQFDLNDDGIIQNFEKGAFKIVNSYGANYGNNGFIWVMYDALNSVSNTDIQNADGRLPFISDYAYYVINVDEYPLDLITEITVTVSRRKQVKIDLGLSSVNSTVPQQGPVSTFIAYTGGEYNYDGINKTVQTATFPFDFGTIVTHPAPWKNYYLQIKDSSFYPEPVIIDKIEFIDSNGKEVVSDTEEKSINNTTINYRYKIGMVGDVDNNALINSMDLTAIQRHLAKISMLSDEALILADVDNDGSVSNIDATTIQRVLAQLDSGFEKGIYARLD